MGVFACLLCAVITQLPNFIKSNAGLYQTEEKDKVGNLKIVQTTYPAEPPSFP